MHVYATTRFDSSSSPCSSHPKCGCCRLQQPCCHLLTSTPCTWDHNRKANLVRSSPPTFACKVVDAKLWDEQDDAAGDNQDEQNRSRFDHNTNVEASGHREKEYMPGQTGQGLDGDGDTQQYDGRKLNGSKEDVEMDEGTSACMLCSVLPPVYLCVR